MSRKHIAPLSILLVTTIITWELISAITRLKYALYFQTEGVPSTGVVIEQIPHPCPLGTTGIYNCYFPKIKFKTEQGEEVIFTNPNDYLGQNVYSVGATTKILYDPKNPKSAVVNQYDEVLRDAISDFSMPLFLILSTAFLIYLKWKGSQVSTRKNKQRKTHK